MVQARIYTQQYKVIFAKTGNISVPTVGMVKQLQLFRLPWIDKLYNRPKWGGKLSR